MDPSQSNDPALQATAAPDLTCTVAEVPVAAPFAVWRATCQVTSVPAGDSHFAVYVKDTDAPPVCEGDIVDGSGECQGMFRPAMYDIARFEEATFVAVLTPSADTLSDNTPEIVPYEP
jgi:hypothetical protein